MKNKIISILTGVFLIGLLIFLVAANLSKPRIFILHSYAQDFSWVNDINEGLLRILDKKPYSLRYHYMDTKRHPSEDYKQKAGTTARNMIKKWNPDVLIAIDDNAQKYVATYFLNDPNMKILFTGVNADAEEYTYHNADNATGILERIPFTSFRDIFYQLLDKDKNRIVHISDDSTTSELIHQELEKVEWAPLNLVKSFQCKTFTEWKAAIEEAPQLGDILLVTHYHTIKDENGKIILPRKIIEWTEPNIKIPFIGCWGFFVEDGGMMAVAVSPYEQGEVVAKMLVDIIEKNVNTKNIPIQVSKQFVVYIREKSIKSRNIDMPILLEAFARATNNYYEDN